MPFDNRKYHAPAERGDVAAVALQASIGFNRIQATLDKLASDAGVDVSEFRAKVKETSDKLESQFDKLTGWTPDEG